MNTDKHKMVQAQAEASAMAAQREMAEGNGTRASKEEETVAATTFHTQSATQISFPMLMYSENPTACCVQASRSTSIAISAQPAAFSNISGA